MHELLNGQQWLFYPVLMALEDMQCYAGLNLTLCDDRQVWRANIMPAVMPGGVQSIQPTTETLSSFICAYFTQIKTFFFCFNSQRLNVKCNLKQSRRDYTSRYSAWLINVAVLHNEKCVLHISIGSKFGDFRLRLLMKHSQNPGWTDKKCTGQKRC